MLPATWILDVIYLFTDGPLDALDHSSDRFAFGSKVGIDATRKSFKLDGFSREWPKGFSVSG